MDARALGLVHVPDANHEVTLMRSFLFQLKSAQTGVLSVLLNCHDAAKRVVCCNVARVMLVCSMIKSSARNHGCSSAAQALHATPWEDAIVWGAPSEDEAAPDALADSQPRSPDADADDDAASLRSVQTVTAPAPPALPAAGQNGLAAPMDWSIGGKLL